MFFDELFRIVLPDFETSFGPLVDGDCQILHFFIIDFEHRSVHFKIFICGFLGGSVENFIASDGHDSLVGPITDHTV